MGLVDPKSLAVTLGRINLALLEGENLSRQERKDAASWIASRMDAPGSYRGLPAPTGTDRHTKLRLFTGETVGSHAGTGCKLGFEATWALAVLRPKEAPVVRAAESCMDRVIERFAQETARRQGMYCCYSCSCAGWRALGAAPAGQAGDLLKAGLAILRSCRDGKGRWHQFPFWYTLLALNGMDRPDALEEMRYAAPALERAVRGKAMDAFSRRRRLLAGAVLERV